VATEDFDIFEYLPSKEQLTWFGSQFAPGAGILDASGQMPEMPTGDAEFLETFSAEDMPSMAENIQRGGLGYLDAGLQGLGVLGDASYALGPLVGGTVGTALKAPAAVSKAVRRGIASLDFSVADLKKLFINRHPEVGKIDPETGNPVTPSLIRTRANALERDLKKPAVRRREEARAANTIEDLVPQERIILDPNDLYGHSLVPVQGDRSGIGTLTDIKGVPLSFPVKVQGGPGYPQFMGSGRGWASMEGAANRKQINFIKALHETGMPPLGVYTAMGREGINFSTPVALSLVGQLDYLKVAKNNIASFNKSVREGTKKQKGIKDFVGLDSPDLVPQLLGDVPSSASAGDLRKAVITEMQKPTRQSQGFPIYEDVLQTITNPDLRYIKGPKGTPEALNPAETGYSIFRADTAKPTYKDPYHLSYDTVIPGDYMGGLTNRGVRPELMFPQNFARMQKEINVAGQPLTRSQQIGAMRSRHMVEPVTDELIENLANHLNRTYGTKYNDGGAVEETPSPFSKERVYEIVKEIVLDGYTLEDEIKNEFLKRINVPFLQNVKIKGGKAHYNRPVGERGTFSSTLDPRNKSISIQYQQDFAKKDGGPVTAMTVQDIDIFE